MKKRTAVLLLIAAILLSVLSINVFAENADTWYEFTKLTLKTSKGTVICEANASNIDHKTKTVVFYGEHNKRIRQAELAGVDDDVTIKNADDIDIRKDDSEYSLTISKPGKEDVTYKIYFVLDGFPFHSVSYPVSATAKENIVMQEGITEYTSDTKQIDLAPDTNAKASHLQLNGFLGEITKASQGVTISADKKSATVNWYQANGKINLWLKWTQDGTEKETPEDKPITIIDQRVSKLNDTWKQTTHGEIRYQASLYSGKDIIWRAYPEDGYKLEKFTVTDAAGQPVSYTMDTADSNMMSLPIPYGEFSVSASFVPLAEGDKSSVALLKSFTIGGRTATPDSNHNVVIEGVPKSTDLSTLTPTFVLSNGASVDDADTLTFEPNVRKKITVRAENDINTSLYYITIKQIQLDGEGTEQSPFLITSADDFKKFMQMPVAAVYKQTADLDLTGVTGTAGSLISSFSGTYDGDGHKISNLSLSSNSNAALFGNLTGTVRNVTMDQTCSFSGKERVASIAVFLSENGKIEGCKNYATITCTPASVDNSTNMYVGGIVAETTQNGTTQINHLKDCENHGTLTIAGDIANSGRVGGIAGSINGCFVQNCQNYVDITSGKSSEGYYGSTGNIAGGIAGQAAGNNTLVGCGNSGNISAGGYVGGIVGLAKNTRNSSLLIESCFNTGEISAYNSSCDQNAGGIAGSAFGDIRNCYNTGKISGAITDGNANRAAILGYANVETGSNDAAIYHSYAVEADSVSVGGQDEKITVSNDTTLMAAEQMKAQAFVDTLNAYTRPRTLVGVTFALPAEGENHGYPVVASCSRVQNYEAAIHAFTLAGRQGEIDEEKHTISVFLPYGTAVTALTPEIETSQGAQLDKTGAQDFTNPVSYQVTSEDGSASVAYTVTVTVAAQATGLRHLGVKLHNRELPMTDGPDGKKQVTVTDAELSKGIQKLTIEYLTNNGSKASAEIDGTTLKEATSNVYDYLEWSYNTNSLTSGTRTLELSFGSETQIIEIIIQPTLESLTVQAGEQNLKVTKTDDGYAVDVPTGTEQLTVTAAATLKSDSVQVNGQSSPATIPVEDFEVTVGSTTFPVVIKPVKPTNVSFTTDPAEAAVTVLDQDGTPVQPDDDGVYSLIGGKDYSYTYRVSCRGYVTKEGTLNASRLKGGSLVVDISLTKVSTGGDTKPTEPMYGDWTSFRGNDDNNGVTSAKTPLSKEESHVQWAIAAGMPTPPILLDGKVYVQVGEQIRKLDPETGKVLQTSEQLADSSQFAMNPLAYGDRMIFVLLGSGSRARVQALDADTLESLWISEEIRGQNISPLTYHDGYLYAGTWNSETADGTYYCLSATDEDPKRPDEIKKTSWTVTHAGGFYWAGAYATDDYVIFGSDNGKNGYTEAGAVLYSVNAKTGQLISSLSKDIIGDIRSTVVHDGNSVYFTTKAGYFYRATVEENGQLRDLKSFKMAGMSTGTPVICGDVAFVTCSGASQFSDSGKLYAVDTATMEKIAEISTPGYVQSSLLVSNAYQAEENTLYIYATYNKMPGGLYLLKYQLNQKTFSGEDLFVPEGTQAQYNICSPICDAEGTIYFKNDSGYLFAVACGARDKAVVKVEETINALPDADQLTLENKEAVAAARAAFDALHETQQAQVSKAAQDKLAAAEAAIAKLEAAEADKAAAAKVEETINALPAAADITLENKEAVAAARAAFDALTKAQQALVSKEAQDKLTACEARIAELEKPEKPTDLPFTDLTLDWYMDSIRYVYEHELMYGTTDTTFAPDDALTRGMFVTMLYRMEGKPEATGNTSFTDVPANMYYAPAIAWASANGVVYGTSETAFSPEGKITREQMAAMMRRYASFKKLDTSAKADLSTFTDASAVSAWATGDLQWAVASELLYGNTRNQLQPTANATRAQAAAILQRFATKIVK